MAIYSWFTQPLKMVIFHSYVSLPEGIFHWFLFWFFEISLISLLKNISKTMYANPQMAPSSAAHSTPASAQCERSCERLKGRMVSLGRCFCWRCSISYLIRHYINGFKTSIRIVCGGIMGFNHIYVIWVCLKMMSSPSHGNWISEDDDYSNHQIVGHPILKQTQTLLFYLEKNWI